MSIIQGTVLFLEEDHFVSEDFLYVLNLMQEQAAAAMPDNKVMVLSTQIIIKWIIKYLHYKVFIRAHNRVLASLLFRSGGHNMFGHIPEEV